jgi:hypothetical protein
MRLNICYTYLSLNFLLILLTVLMMIIGKFKSFVIDYVEISV